MALWTQPARFLSKLTNWWLMADCFRLRVRLVSATLLTVAIPAAMVAAQTPERTPPLPPGQVWQCVHDGHKIFSDAPCGSGATIRQLNDVNVMDAAPATRIPGYPPGVATPGVATPRANAPYAPTFPEEGTPEAAPDGTPVYGVQAVGIADRWQRVRHIPRPLHRARPAVRAAGAHAAAR
jgi:hypothetical protein